MNARIALVSCIGFTCAGAAPRPAPDAGEARAAAIESEDDASARIPGVVVVDFTDGTTKAEFDALERAWGIDLELADEEEGRDSAITVGGFEGTDAEVQALLARIRADAHVEAAEPLMKLSASWVPDDPLFARQWNLEMLHVPQAWEQARGRGVVVAVLDTGIAWEDREAFVQAPDLQGTRFVQGYNFIDDTPATNDDHGHGTHVAGTIAQRTNNGLGAAGIAFEATLMPVKVLDHFGVGHSAEIADAIRWAADHGAKVLNLSFGGGGRSEVLAHAVRYARSKGAVVVCAAGNTGRGIVEFPAASPGAVAVGAVGPSGARAPYSAWGAALDLLAPGGDTAQGEAGGIVQNTLDPRDLRRTLYASYQGTSMAAPHVAGVAALLWSAGASSVEAVEEALFAGAHPPAGHTGWSEAYGHGLLDAQASLLALRSAHASHAEASAGDQQLSQPKTSRAALEALATASSVVAAPASWQRFGWAVALLAMVLLTLPPRRRPGLFNVLFRPSFVLPLLLLTVGTMLLSSGAGAEALAALGARLESIRAGAGLVARPLVASAALPLLAAVLARLVRPLRSAAAGVALGVAAQLAAMAWARQGWPPLNAVTGPWLVGNTLLCLLLARALLKREVA